ncbi:transient receptor potential cation channel subfamily A member 1-like [Dysidea avara]|uniref:transient receptor potential cation channel subfamily A member 1-like n=1 Tax=Dysidea avara TaxID=196820 RepID=UPI00332E982A
MCNGSFHDVDYCSSYCLAIFGRMGNKMTPLHWAATNNHPDVMSLLISHGADVNMKDWGIAEEQSTWLMLSSLCGVWMKVAKRNAG